MKGTTRKPPGSLIIDSFAKFQFWENYFVLYFSLQCALAKCIRLCRDLTNISLEYLLKTPTFKSIYLSRELLNFFRTDIVVEGKEEYRERLQNFIYICKSLIRGLNIYELRTVHPVPEEKDNLEEKGVYEVRYMMEGISEKLKGRQNFTEEERAELRLIVYLDLSEDSIGDDGLVGLTKSLLQNASLISLDLSENNIGDGSRGSSC